MPGQQQEYTAWLLACEARKGAPLEHKHGRMISISSMTEVSGSNFKLILFKPKMNTAENCANQ